MAILTALSWLPAARHGESPTQRNAAHGEGITDPRRAYQQQAAVELSAEGIAWLGERLQAA